MHQLRMLALVALSVIAAALVVPAEALGAVSIRRAELSSGSLRVEGVGAIANATVSVSSPESSVTGRADSRGEFRISATGYRSSTCRVQVSDGSTSAVATLSGCTPASSPSLSSLAVGAASLVGGTSTTGTATLTSAAPSGGAVVTLSSSNAAVASVPASVTVAAGATSVSFPVSTTAVTAQTPVTLTAVWGGVTRTASMTVTPPAAPAPALTLLALSHTSLSEVGTLAVGEVRLASVTAAPVTVALSSSNPAIAPVSASSVQVEPGFDQAVFTVRHLAAVTAPTLVTITASAGGVTLTTTITINPAQGVTITANGPLGPGFVGSDFTTYATLGTVIALGPPAVGPVSWRVSVGQLPAGLSLADVNTSGTPAKHTWVAVVGVPTRQETRTFSVTLTDANGISRTGTYTITVNAALSLAINLQTPWSPVVGSFTNLWIDGAGGVRPYRWAVIAGQLPPGMSLVQDNPNGALVRVTGTPTAAGTFTFTLRLRDATGATASRVVSVTVT